MRCAPGIPVSARPLPAEEDELEDEFAENAFGTPAREAQKWPIPWVFCAGGAEGGRTPDLLIANEALSQLSYGPRQVRSPKRGPKGQAWGACECAPFRARDLRSQGW